MKMRYFVYGIVTLIIVIGALWSMDMLPGVTTDSWSWDLEPGGYNDMVITQEMIDCVGSNEIEVIFAPIMDKIDLIIQKQNGQWKSYVPEERPHQTMYTVFPTAEYPVKVQVYESVTFTIEKC